MKEITVSDIKKALKYADLWPENADVVIEDHNPEDKTFWMRLDFHEGGFTQIQCSYTLNVQGEISGVEESDFDEDLGDDYEPEYDDSCDQDWPEEPMDFGMFEDF